MTTITRYLLSTKKSILFIKECCVIFTYYTHVVVDRNNYTKLNSSESWILEDHQIFFPLTKFKSFPNSTSVCFVTTCVNYVKLLLLCHVKLCEKDIHNGERTFKITLFCKSNA